jgi:outer membrane protein OmpA-like peptidoglycan-associated protein
MKTLALVTGLSAMLLATSACTTNPDTGQRKFSRAGTGALIGSGGGALLGAVLGGRNNRAETLIGAGIGAVAGAGIGAYMDRQERELRAKTAGSGIQVQRVGDEIKLQLPANVTFDFNSATLKPQFRPSIEKVAQILSGYQSTFVDVYGHTDSIGSDDANQKLSEARASNVADSLGVLGVNRARIATKGFGKTQPIASNDTETGRTQNRRVEIRIAPVTEQDVAPKRAG